MSVHVDEHVYAVTMNPVGGHSVTFYLRQFDEVLSFRRYFTAERSAVVGAQSVTEYFEPTAVMHAGDRLHQMRKRMIAEIATHVSNLDATCQFK